MNACFLIILICLHFADKASCCGVPDGQFPINKPDEPGNRDAPRKPNQRIWGGEEANPHSLPWQVYIYVDRILPDGQIKTGLCGGSIISPYWVVTATHCMVDRIVSLIVAGAHNRYDEVLGNRQVRKNAKIIEHPDFGATEGFDNDIALLKLDEPFQFNSYVQPVCVTDQAPSEDSICLTSGWGIRETGFLSAVLEQLYMDVMDSAVCLATYGFHNPETKICAWDKDKSDKTACSGDSGGPLVCKSNTEKEWSLIGVTSYGGSCEFEIPMVFTKVSKYINWIEEHMRSVSAVENLALHKDAFQSSTAFGGIASRAVDGIREGRFGLRSCTRTKESNRPWWAVDLGSEYQLESVLLMNRGDCCNWRLSDFIMGTTDVSPSVTAPTEASVRVCHRQQDVLGLADVRTFTCEEKGRYVVVLRPRDTVVLTLCEVEVYGKPIGPAADVGFNRMHEGELGEIEGKEHEGMDGQEHDGMIGQEHEGMIGQEHEGMIGQEHEGIDGQKREGMDGQEHEEKDGKEHERMENQERKGMKGKEREGTGLVKTNDAYLRSADLAIGDASVHQTSSASTASIIAVAATAVGVVLVLLVAVMAATVRMRARTGADQDHVIKK